MVDSGLLVVIVVLVVVLLLAAWILGTYNKIVRLENRIDNAWGQIDVQLRRRGELIPNLVETVRGYAKHEKELFERIAQARAQMLGGGSIKEKMAGENMLESTLKTLFAVAEAYPDLKANTNFLQLQDELTHTENKVAFARQHYNDSVTDYNNTIETFPGLIFGAMFNKKERPVLEAPPATREVPKVSF